MKYDGLAFGFIPVEFDGAYGIRAIGPVSDFLLTITVPVWSFFMFLGGVEPDGFPVKPKRKGR